MTLHGLLVQFWHWMAEPPLNKPQTNQINTSVLHSPCESKEKEAIRNNRDAFCDLVCHYPTIAIYHNKSQRSTRPAIHNFADYCHDFHSICHTSCCMDSQT